MESNESSPLRALDSTGTPKTGSIVFDAVMPGRCAAPCSRDDHFDAARFGAGSVFEQQIRSAVRRDDFCFVGMPSSDRILAAGSSVSQSDEEPMITPTSGSPCIGELVLPRDGDFL